MATPEVWTVYDGKWARVPLKRENGPVEFVADVKEAIKSAKQNALKDYDPDQLTLKAVKKVVNYQKENFEAVKNSATELDGEDSLDLVLRNYGVNGAESLVDANGKTNYDEACNSFAENIWLFIELPQASSALRRKAEEELSPSVKKLRYADPLIVISEERLHAIEEKLELYPINLLRSPPSSGKTTLAIKLETYFMDKGYETRRIIAHQIHEEALDDKTKFDAAWVKLAGKSWSDCINFDERGVDNPIIILIDEAQILYGKSDFFWTNIKALQDGFLTQNLPLRLLLFSMFDGRYASNTATPIDFKNPLGLDDLLLMPAEFDDLVAMFIEHAFVNFAWDLKYPDELLGALFSATRGHPSLVKSSLQYFYNIIRSKGSDNLPQELLSTKFLDYLLLTRTFDWMRSLELDPDTLAFLRHACLSKDENFIFAPLTVGGIHESLIRSGLVTRAPFGCLRFAAPLVHLVVWMQLRAKHLSPLLPTADNFAAFLLLSIERMRPKVLRNSLSHGGSEGSRLLERAWQNEWYLAANTAAPNNATISPDVGSIYGSSGFLDFYVNSEFQWGVELMREGANSANHYNRFAHDGGYKEIPFKSWVIIDFRHHTNPPDSQLDNFWYALYEEDYSKITVKRLGAKDDVVTLRGDEF